MDRVKSYFRPSELGFIVNDLIVINFPDIFNVEFTARMEDKLDQIEQNEANALSVLEQFYTPFKAKLDDAADGMLSIKGVGFPTELNCPQCNSRLHIKVGKNGPFIACSAYPGMQLLARLRSRRERPGPAGGTRGRCPLGQDL